MDKIKYKAAAIITILVLSIATSCLAVAYAANPESFSQTPQKSSLVLSSPGVIGIEEHKLTSAELEELQNEVGVFQEGQNYNQIVDGHGTGLSPPTIDEWSDIAENAHVIDSVSYQSVPSAVDNSATPWFPPIGNQDGQGSCTAWAVGYYVKTFQEAKEHSWDFSGAAWEGGYYGYPTASYQDKIMSPAFIYHLINNGVDQGSSFEDAITLVCYVGECSWQKMPYDPLDDTTWPSEAAWTEAPVYRGNSSFGYQYLDANTDMGLSNLKSWLASGNLAVIAVDADQYDNLTSTDVWTMDNYQTVELNHANTIVGYDDSITYMEEGVERSGAFKVANSWGIGSGPSSWENDPDGFYWISYNTMKELSTGNPCMLFQDLIGYQPEILATFGINHNVRSDCRITFGLGTPSSPITSKRFHDYIFGGAFPFCSNNIVLDITEFKSYMPSFYNQPLFMRVFDKGTFNGGTSTTGTIIYFGVGAAISTQTPVITANYFNVDLAVTYSLVNPTLNLSPTSGPSSGSITLNGADFTVDSSVNISYLNPLTSIWTPVISNLTTVSGNFSYTLTAPDLLQSNPTGDNPPASNSIVFRAQDNSNGNSYNTTVPYTEWRRGLTQIANSSATGIYGNSTDFAASIFVQNGDAIAVCGKWFSPGTAAFQWDGTVDLGTAPIDDTGMFNTSLVVPATTAGAHNLTINDGSCNFCVNLTRLPTVANDYVDEWHTSDFTINLSPNYNVDETFYRINDGPVYNVTADGQPTITSEGVNNTLEYWSTWNVYGTDTMELQHVTVTGIKLDKTAPFGSITPSSSTVYSPAITLFLAATDDVSGVWQMRFSNGGNEWSNWESYSVSKAWTLQEGTGVKTVTVQYMNNAGLTSTYSCTVTLATSNPQATSSPTATPTTKNASPSNSPTTQPSATPQIPELNLQAVLIVLAASTLMLALVWKRRRK